MPQNVVWRRSAVGCKFGSSESLEYPGNMDSVTGAEWSWAGGKLVSELKEHIWSLEYQDSVKRAYT